MLPCEREFLLDYASMPAERLTQTQTSKQGYIRNLIFIFNHFLDYGFNLSERTKFIEDQDDNEQECDEEQISTFGAGNLEQMASKFNKEVDEDEVPLHFWDLITKYMADDFSTIQFINEYI